MPKQKNEKELVVLSKLAANRAEFFELLSDLERLTGRTISEDAITAEIDAEFPNCTRVSFKETRQILRAVA